VGSKFAKAKPTLTGAKTKSAGKPISSNSDQLRHPGFVKPARDNKKVVWFLKTVIHEHRRKRFSPDDFKTEKGEPTFQPKSKYVAWIVYENSRDDVPGEFFAYALPMKDGSYKLLSPQQEKRFIAKLNYRNGVKIVDGKNFDLERVQRYGNRLPRCGVLAGPDQPLHHVGFVSDREAVKLFEVSSVTELTPSDKLLFGEKRPYIPNQLAGLVRGVEEENIEVDASDDEESQESNHDQKQSEEQDDDAQPDSVVESDENDIEVVPQKQQSESEGEPVDEVQDAVNASRKIRGNKYTEIHTVVSKTDLLARMAQLDTADSGHTYAHSGKAQNTMSNNETAIA
jgi:hypothetical protein